MQDAFRTVDPALMIARFLGILPVVNHAPGTAPENDLPDMIPDDESDLPPLGD